GLRFGDAQRRFRRFSKVRLIRRMTDERSFGLRRAPWLGANAAQGDARPGNILAREIDHDGGGGESELVGRAVAQLKIELLALFDRRGQRDVSDKISRLEDRFAVR